MPEKAEKFVTVNVKESVKREIDMISAHENRPIYEIIDDAWVLYKIVAVGKTPKKGKKNETVPVVDVITAH